MPDYRHPSYTRHLLGDIIMIVLFAVLGNANEWGEIENFAKRKEKWLRKCQKSIRTKGKINYKIRHFFI